MKAHLWVENGEEVVKYLLAGADAVMTTSALLRHSAPYIGVLLAQLEDWLQARDLSLEQMRGSMSQRNLPEPEVFERANYMRILESWKPVTGT